MSDRFSHLTPYPDVNSVLHALLADVRAILGERFVAMYLYGSLASGDFNPQTSDIDFVVVTTDELSGEVLAVLEAMHARIAASGSKWAVKLEGSYIPQTALRRYKPNDAPRATLNEGRFYLAPHQSDWVIQRHILREQGVVLAGPDPTKLIEPVAPEEVRRAVVGILREWWSPLLAEPARLRGGEYQAYAFLTMCRALYTFEFGTVVSKPVAARWAQRALGERWAPLIAWALVWQPGVEGIYFGETLDFIGYTLERAAQEAG